MKTTRRPVLKAIGATAGLTGLDAIKDELNGNNEPSETTETSDQQLFMENRDGDSTCVSVEDTTPDYDLGDALDPHDLPGPLWQVHSDSEYEMFADLPNSNVRSFLDLDKSMVLYYEDTETHIKGNDTPLYNLAYVVPTKEDSKFADIGQYVKNGNTDQLEQHLIPVEVGMEYSTLTRTPLASVVPGGSHAEDGAVSQVDYVIDGVEGGGLGVHWDYEDVKDAHHTTQVVNDDVAKDQLHDRSVEKMTFYKGE